MKAIINNTLLSNLKPKSRDYDIWDKKLTGLILRVQSNGRMVYRCEYARGKRATIGKTSIITPAQARDRAKQILGDAAKGIAPTSSKKKPHNLTFKKFIEHDYSDWVNSHRKTGKETIDRIKLNFFDLIGSKELSEISPLIIEKWRSSRLNDGLKASSINRNSIALKAALSKAVEWGFIDTHPLSKLKPLKIDHSSKVRFLTPDEEKKLRDIINEREERLRILRDNGNLWRQERGYEEKQSLRVVEFADYIKPMILISLNTGLRKGELFNLKWENVNFNLAHLTICGEYAKSGKTRHIPMNKEVLSTLTSWQKQSSQLNGLVFPSKTGNKIYDIKKAWSSILKKAQINNFRWHDMRHHFASKLVMLGIDLNTVRELLGHSDLEMTLRYAHLAPEHKASAVEKLVA